MVADWNLKNINSGQLIEICGGVFRAGRSSNFEIICLSKSVSRMHARFTVEAGNFYVEDMNSANGTYINSRKISQKEQIRHGDVVGLGSSNLTSSHHIGNDPLYIFQVVKQFANGSADILDILQSEDNEETLVNEGVTGTVNSPDQMEISPEGKICNANETTDEPIDTFNQLEISLREKVSRIYELNVFSNEEVQISPRCIATNNLPPQDEKIPNPNELNVLSNEEVQISPKRIAGVNQPPQEEEIPNPNELNVLPDGDVHISSKRIASVNHPPQEEDISNPNELKTVSNEEIKSSFARMNSDTTECAQLDQGIRIKTEKLDILDIPPPVGYSVEDDVIVIEDDEDCDFSSSQLFTSITSASAVNDSLLAKIKVELEEIDRDDGEKLIVINDSDSESDWLGSEDIAAQITKLEQELNHGARENSDLIKGQSSPDVLNDECTTEKANLNVASLPKRTCTASTSKYTKPPIIEPHDLEVFHKKKLNKTSTDTRKGGTKRKNQGDEPTKKKRQKSSSNRNDRGGASSKLQAQSRNNKRKSDFIDKDEKEKIKQIRKTKLKELEVKNSDKNAAGKSIFGLQRNVDASCNWKQAANVKVSDGRGNFLLPIENKVEEHKTKLDKVAPPKENQTNLNAQVKNSENRTTANKNPKDPRISRTESSDEAKEITYITLKSKDTFSNSKVPRNNPSSNNNSPFLSLDVILNIINWKTTWLEEQAHLSEPPPVNKRIPVQMCHSFSSHSDYCNIVNPLLTLELWNMVYKEWLSAADKTRQESRKFWGSIESVEPQNNYVLLKSISYVTKEQRDARKHVKECDVILINVPLMVQNKLVVKKIFAYVSSCTRKVLHSNDYIDGYLAKRLSAVPNSALALDIMIRCVPGICLEKHIEGGIIASLTSPLREFDAVQALGNSPLCKYILDPKIEDYLIPRVHNERIITKDNLCETQRQVVLEAVSLCAQDSPGIYLIQGPPGTGKTTVITNILQNVLLNEKIREPRILLVAPSNTAVDGIILKINKEIKPHLTEHQRRKIKLLRIGPRPAIHDDVKPYFLDELAKKHVNCNFFAEFPEVSNDYGRLRKNKESLAREIHRERELGRNTTGREKRLQELTYEQENFPKTYLKQKYFERFSAAKRILMGGANVICTTLSSCIRLEEHDLSLGKMTCCIVDEATQSNEPETLIPLMLGIRKLILVGDPQQLPAVTVSQYAKELGHGQSLFARIKRQFNDEPSNPIRMLNVQYRMHPEISRFPSSNFYNGELLNSPTYIQREGLDKLAAYYVFNLNSKSRFDNSYTNEDEVDCVVKLLNAITNTVGSNLNYSVGIITPYNTQKTAINKKLVGYSNNSEVSIAVNTVDSFQGSEKDVIILSCVRYSPNNFLSDENRLNVAITRAKHVLYIIGTYSLFQHCATLSRIKRDAENRNLYLNINCSVNTNILQAVITSK